MPQQHVLRWVLLDTCDTAPSHEEKFSETKYSITTNDGEQRRNTLGLTGDSGEGTGKYLDPALDIKMLKRTVHGWSTNRETYNLQTGSRKIYGKCTKVIQKGITKDLDCIY